MVEQMEKQMTDEELVRKRANWETSLGFSTVTLSQEMYYAQVDDDRQQQELMGYE